MLMEQIRSALINVVAQISDAVIADLADKGAEEPNTRGFAETVPTPCTDGAAGPDDNWRDRDARNMALHLTNPEHTIERRINEAKQIAEFISFGRTPPTVIGSGAIDKVGRGPSADLAGSASR